LNYSYLIYLVTKIRNSYKNALIDFRQKENDKIGKMSPKISLRSHKTLQSQLLTYKNELIEKSSEVVNLKVNYNNII